ncbi:glycosyltransferase family 4 protein [Inquilinus sp. CAU 1745]|uniref:glycosyltransferase family 4 protein n=1 Tax=Inquilinus sp. CAU 1745 TaxID=3140369 RepID=UPI00325B214C
MKIAFVIHSMVGGGAERVTANLANAWSGRGWEVTILTLAARSMDAYAFNPGVRRIALNAAGESASPVSAIAANLRRVWAIRRALRQVSPDVVLAMMTTANVLALLAVCGTRIPVVVSERVYPPMLPVGRAWAALRRWTYPRARAVVALTIENARWLEQNCPGSRTTVIPNPVPWPLPDGEPRLSPAGTLADGCRLLLAVGRLVPQKGFDSLLNAFARLASANPDWHLVIVGEGQDRLALETQRARMGLEGRVHLPGHVGNIRDWYARADLFVLSSRFEGFPNVLAEAMASGCPAVSFDCDTGPRDIIRSGIDGLLVPLKEGSSGLADGMCELICDDERRHVMALRATEVRERLSQPHILQLWEDLFDDIARHD